ncbi:MAG: DUF4381 domain-containing protein [Idiomarina sp.]|nr:DUF4381 domain-containing protein [Idiomarina sp.]
MITEALQQLHDISEADTSQLWPLAWGWWIVILLTLLTFALTRYGWRRYSQRHHVRKQALNALKTAHVRRATELTALCKRVALHYFPTQPIEEMTGPTWLEFMQQTLPMHRQIDQNALNLIAQSMYGPEQEQSLSEYQMLAERWLREAVPPRNSAVGGSHDV